MRRCFAGNGGKSTEGHFFADASPSMALTADVPDPRSTANAGVAASRGTGAARVPMTAASAVRLVLVGAVLQALGCVARADRTLAAKDKRQAWATR
eukprot:CAMPEP_0117570004 /NCGR_PEP_ID=MMETSP0784-20121206/58962_1 /TAXON_ID=39447 /ORGANISM="" /LENGTH=95 /DNA_ID=CAMNT_0005368019 /DNA_START=113 /DNA_END=397 /DNA_ORIENTATION=+